MVTPFGYPSGYPYDYPLNPIAEEKGMKIKWRTSRK